MQNAITMKINEIQPSQLYISKRKHQACHDLFTQNGFDSYEPVPIKKIGNDTFFTDGHTRALVLWQNGHKEISIQIDNDDMDWIAYLACIKWCRDNQILSIADLSNRMLNDQEYQEKWLNRCSDIRGQLKPDPLRDLSIQMEEDGDRKQVVCSEILRSLPQWFGIEESTVEYIANVHDLPFITVTLYEKVIGFCALNINYEINADLYVLGLFEEFHRRGIGKKLITYLEGYCRQHSLKYMTVKTLSEQHPDLNYGKTREFYSGCGFASLEEFPGLWGEANPCLYMLREVPKL